MAGGPLRIWNEWGIQVLVLLSFTLQVVLLVFAGIRRREGSAALKLLLWLAYLTADSTAVYTLGHLSIGGWTREHQLVAFWAPFLLLHLGSQDTITAYALVDNQLWLRHLLTLVVQALGVAYVLYKHVAGDAATMVVAALLMFIVGVLKYGERILALKCSSMDGIRSSVKREQEPRLHPEPRLPRGQREDREEEELLLFAHSQFHVSKHAMVDSSILQDSHHTIFSESWNSKDACRLMELELSLVYDFMYTKAVVIHNWYGYSIRLIAPAATVTAFFLFQICGKHGYSRVDIVITYILLLGAFLLDIISLFRAMGSTWTCDFLLTRRWSWLLQFVMSLRRLVRAGRYRMWSGSIGQYDLLLSCTHDKTKLWDQMAKMMGLEDWWNKKLYSETLLIQKDVKDLVFERVWQRFWSSCSVGDTEGAYSMRDIMGSWGQEAVRRFKQSRKIDVAFGREFQEDILAWHIATEIFLSHGDRDEQLINEKNATLVEAIKTLSRYLMFLVAVREHMLPGLVLRGLYDVTRQALNGVWMGRKRTGRIFYRSAAKEKLATILDEQNFEGRWGRHDPKTRLIYDGAELATALQNASISIMSADIRELLELIFNVWVDKLVYASTRGRTDSHIKQLSSGGELTTIVWIMAQHAGLFRIGELRPEPDPGPAMAGEFRKGKEKQTGITPYHASPLRIGEILEAPVPDPELATPGEFRKGEEKQTEASRTWESRNTTASSAVFSSSDTKLRRRGGSSSNFSIQRRRPHPCSSQSLAQPMQHPNSPSPPMPEAVATSSHLPLLVQSHQALRGGTMIVDNFLLSNAMMRPDSEVCVVYPSKRMVKRDKELQQAVVAMVVGGRCQKLTVQDVAAILRKVLGLEKGLFKAVPYHPEHFLIVFSSLEDKRRALAQSPLKGPNFSLVLNPWCRQQNAVTNRLFFKVDLELVGIPAHAWNWDTVAKLLSTSCWIEKLDSCTPSVQKDLSVFKLTAWAYNPGLIPRVKWLLVLEPDIDEEVVGPVVLTSEVPDFTRTEMRFLRYKILINLCKVNNYIVPSANGNFGSDGQSDADNFGSDEQSDDFYFGSDGQSDGLNLGSDGQSDDVHFGSDRQSDNNNFGCDGQSDNNNFGSDGQSDERYFGSCEQSDDSNFGSSGHHGDSNFGPDEQPGDGNFGPNRQPGDVNSGFDGQLSDDNFGPNGQPVDSNLGAAG